MAEDILELRNLTSKTVAEMSRCERPIIKVIDEGSGFTMTFARSEGAQASQSHMAKSNARGWPQRRHWRGQSFL